MIPRVGQGHRTLVHVVEDPRKPVPIGRHPTRVNYPKSLDSRRTIGWSSRRPIIDGWSTNPDASVLIPRHAVSLIRQSRLPSLLWEEDVLLRWNRSWLTNRTGNKIQARSRSRKSRCSRGLFMFLSLLENREKTRKARNKGG